MVQDSYIKIPDFVRFFVKNLDDSTVSNQAHKLLFFFFSSFMMFGALVWGLICLVYGYRMPSLIPFGYVILTLFNFVLIGSKYDTADAACVIQIFASICLPFAFQYTLGGIASSGFVMLWSILALLGSIILHEKKLKFIWIGLLVFLTVVSFLSEPQFDPENITYSIPPIVTALNVILVSIFIYFFGSYFVRIQNSFKEKLWTQRKELLKVNGQANEDMMIAKSFQDILLNQDANKEGFFRTFEVKLNMEPVTSNFLWTGRLGDMNVMVYVDNPHKGVRGCMESMLLWNLIDSAVHRFRKMKPEEIVERIQQEVFDRFKNVEMREGAADIGVAVIYYDTIMRQLNYAIVDTTVVINGGDNCKVLKGFKKSYLGSVITKTGSSMSKGRLMINNRTKITFLNDETLRIFDVQSDSELVCEESPLKILFEPKNHIAENNVRHTLKKTKLENDVFLLCAEF